MKDENYFLQKTKLLFATNRSVETIIYMYLFKYDAHKIGYNVLLQIY
jgi:hypothetical protein